MDRTDRKTLATFALFVGSGCAALVYEVVWFHLLSLVIGASGISLAILLSGFMGGMCLGSLLYPRLVSTDRHPFRVYAALEFMIAAFGLLILWVLPAVGRMYWANAGYGYGGMAFRGVIALVVLLPPTILMGATLPAIARGVKATRSGLSRLGFAYGANTFGAVLGSLLAGFYLLRVHDTAVATYVAAGLNLTVAMTALLLSRQSTQDIAATQESLIPADKTGSPVAVFVAIGLSGMTALGAEVVWTRLLALLFGPTVYTFSIILAVFLTGIGLGSAYGAALGRTVRRPGAALAFCQLLLVAAIPFGTWMIIHVVPYVFAARDPSQGIWIRMSLDLVRAAMALLPATCLWGASFPLAVSAAAASETDTGHLVGRVYASNTVGAIIGSLLGSLIGIPVLGTQGALAALTLLSAASGVLLLAYWFIVVVSAGEDESEIAVGRAGIWGAAAALVVAGAASPFAARLIPAVPPGLFAWGRLVDQWPISGEFLHVAEGVDADVVVTQALNQHRLFHVSGKCVASSVPVDLRIERMLGHLPAMAHPEPKTALVVGCGAGVTAGSLLKHPSIERIVICDIEACVPRAAGINFAEENYGVINDPRTQVVIDDARHFLSSTTEKFDVITTDPIHPWVRGAAALYTYEFFEICKEHLNPGGIVAQWVPLYETSEAAVKCELATLFKSFPNATLWDSEMAGNGYDLTVLATADGSPVDLVRMEKTWNSNPQVRASLADVDLDSMELLLTTCVAAGPELASWLSDAEINLDRNLRLQYLAGMSLDGKEQKSIFRIMARLHRQANAPPVEPETASPLAN